jgi:hypothetical protein
MNAMRLLKLLAIFSALLAFACFTVSGSARLSESAIGRFEPWADDPPIDSQGTPPSAQEIRERADQFVANQHKDDEALEEYERIEHHVDRTAGPNPRVIEDRVFRMVPTGAGIAKLLLRDGDKPVDAATYNREIEGLKDTLQTMANPNDSRAKAAYAKRQKHNSDRTEFVDAAKEAFNIKWLGRSTVRGHSCDVFELDPKPDFRPHGLFQDALVHVTARVWVDRQAVQMVRGEARIMSDVSFGGGILGKLYRGGVVSMEQSEVAPGMWMPAHMQYDFAGRKFLFSFEQHQTIDASRYRLVGPPNQALMLVQSELANGKSLYSDP